MEGKGRWKGEEMGSRKEREGNGGQKAWLAGYVGGKKRTTGSDGRGYRIKMNVEWREVSRVEPIEFRVFYLGCIIVYSLQSLGCAVYVDYLW